jgi:hypothetical protein
MKKRFKKHFPLLTNDIQLVHYAMIFERGNAYRYDWNKKKKVLCKPYGHMITFPKGKYFDNLFIIEFDSLEDMDILFGKVVKKHIV